MGQTLNYVAASAAVVLISILVAGVAATGNAAEIAAAVGATSMAVGTVLVFACRKKVHPLSFYAVYTYSHFALFVLRPLYNGLFQGAVDPFGSGPHNDSLVGAALIAGAGYISVALAYGLKKTAGKPIPQVVETPDYLWRNALPWIFGVITLGVLLYSVYVRQVGGLGRLLEVSSGRSVELTQALASSSGYFTSGLLFTLGASALVFCHGLVTGRRFLATLGLGLLIVGSGPQVLTGSRSVFLPLAVTILVCFVWIFPRRIKFWHVLLSVVPVFLVFFIVPRILRSSSVGETTAGVIDQLAPTAALDGFFGGLDTAMIDAFAHQVAEQESGALPAANGSTYLGALGAIVPRAWWADKPETVDTFLNHALFPATAAQSIGFSFGIYSEPFLNFGLLGVVLFCAGLGLTFAVLDNRMMAPMNVFQLSIFALAVGSLFPIVRGSLTFDLQRFLIPAVPVILIYIVAKLAGFRGMDSRSAHGSLRSHVKKTSFKNSPV